MTNLATTEFENRHRILNRDGSKAKSGIATPKQDINLIEKRLKVAQEHHRDNYDNQQN